jgi:hypothetical protein
MCRNAMNDYVKAWQCIGCGKIEAPQICIGICQDRKVQFVYADEYERALADLGPRVGRLMCLRRSCAASRTRTRIRTVGNTPIA